MNFTLRVTTPNRSLIVKQSRGYVEKYPTIAAPANRAVIEGRFYQRVQTVPAVAQCMPQLFDVDDQTNVLVLEDLGAAQDFTFLYQPGHHLSESDVKLLATYLSQLHTHFTSPTPDPAFANRAMRALNHEHIFTYPFLENNGFDLDAIQPGLQGLAMPYKRDEDVKKRATELGKLYLSDEGTTLLHGDYYPGSWLKTAAGVNVIDPEFCFYGPPEFDLGVFVAHLYLSHQPDLVRAELLTTYQRPASFNESLMHQFAGIEILRRLIGLAQLPLSLPLDEKRVLLEQARAML